MSFVLLLVMVWVISCFFVVICVVVGWRSWIGLLLVGRGLLLLWLWCFCLVDRWEWCVGRIGWLLDVLCLLVCCVLVYRLVGSWWRWIELKRLWLLWWLVLVVVVLFWWSVVRVLCCWWLLFYLVIVGWFVVLLVVRLLWRGCCVRYLLLLLIVVYFMDCLESWLVGWWCFILLVFSWWLRIGCWRFIRRLVLIILWVLFMVVGWWFGIGFWMVGGGLIVVWVIVLVWILVLRLWRYRIVCWRLRVRRLDFWLVIDSFLVWFICLVVWCGYWWSLVRCLV